MDTPKKIGRYEVLEELGCGAMGTVYRAKDPAMDRVVAVKTIISAVLAGQQAGEFRERFYREARAAGALAHPGIVPVFDVGEHEGVPFLVMEFVSGKTLADAIRKGERPTLDRLCEIGQKVAEALSYAHQRGVVHRDIKPANILLTSREVYGIERPKITDFGVAKLAEGQTTLTGQLLGTPAYMPPEQFTGAAIDGRADLFSLGVVLYWMATGEQPFPGESMTAVSYKVVHTDPVPPRKLNPSVPATLEGVIMKCLAKSPEDRYQSGDDLARELADVRNSAKMAGSQSVTRTAVRDMDATVVDAPRATGSTTAETPRPAPVAVEVASVPRGAKAPANKKADGRLIMVGVIAAAVLAGGWYLVRVRAKPAPQEAVASLSPAPMPSAEPAAAAAVVPPSPDVAVAKKDDPDASQPPDQSLSRPSIQPSSKPAKAAPPPPAVSPGGSLSAAVPAAKKPLPVVPKADPVVAVEPKAPSPPAIPAPVPVDFDPKTLDPKQNARLKIDSGRMPAGLKFQVEMNGKIYFEGAAAKNTQDINFFVPPGVHEFRVVAKSASTERASNTVSTEFKAKKKKTLTIELRLQGMAPGGGVPQDLYADTQLVLTLK